MVSTSKQSRGFTLIELLVVIAIIGLLASVVMGSLNTARAKSRDAKRVAELHQWQIALEMYRNANRTYPILAGCYGPEAITGQKTLDGWAGDYPADATYGPCQTSLRTALAPYMPQIPIDPLNTGTDQSGGYHYWYASAGSGAGYILLFWPEVMTSHGESCYYNWYCVGMNWK